MYEKPPPFLEVIVTKNSSCFGMCAGYEGGEWRYEAFASHLLEWLPEFSLNHSDLQSLNSGNAVRMLRKAAKVVYSTDKYSKRGEFGELLLHAAIRQVFDTVPAISKLFYKDSTNETVKGFDSVHVVVANNSLELWLGEAKFYKDINRAIRDVVDELQCHTEKNYLREEFLLISNKVDDTFPYAEKLKKLLDPNTSLDMVFTRMCIPVLLTYESEVVESHDVRTDQYVEELTQELELCFDRFISKGLPDVRIHLILVPLHTKKQLLEALHEGLQAWQKG